jgi:cystathionine gamma-synthase
MRAHPSLVLNPASKWYEPLKSVLADEYEDIYYPEDAVYMERNSRDYRRRIKRINDSTFEVCEWLRSQSLEFGDSPSKAIKRVYYPRYMTPEVYEAVRREPTTGKGGYGGLFSLTFVSPEASAAFFDALDCAKGPSLGTSFTLACPYVILAHYLELDWVQQFGVEPGLVRVSMGEEDVGTLKQWFDKAVKAAEATM